MMCENHTTVHGLLILTLIVLILHTQVWIFLGNGKSANVSELSCEMAVTSDTSEKVHGNIPHLAPKISSACRPSEL